MLFTLLFCSILANALLLPSDITAYPVDPYFAVAVTHHAEDHQRSTAAASRQLLQNNVKLLADQQFNVSGILTLVPLSCNETLKQFAETICPSGMFQTVKSLNRTEEMERQLNHMPQKEIMPNSLNEISEEALLGLPFPLPVVAATIEIVVDECCTSSKCSFEQFQAYVSHACKPGFQRSGEILNG